MASRSIKFIRFYIDDKKAAGRKNDLHKGAYDDFYFSFRIFVNSLPVIGTGKANWEQNGSHSQLTASRKKSAKAIGVR